MQVTPAHFPGYHSFVQIPPKTQSELEYQQQIARNLPRNFSSHLAHGLLGQTGFKLINAPTFLPAYILLLSGGSDFAVGLTLALQSLGSCLTPLIGAHIIEHRTRVLPPGFLIGSGMRLCVLFIALAGWLLPPPAALVVIQIFILFMGMFSGMQGVIFNVLMSKVIPVNKRGRLTGYRNFLAGLTSAVVAGVGGFYLIGDNPDNTGYSLLFGLAFILTSIGLAMLIFVREPEPPNTPNRMPLFTRLSQLPALMKGDPAFTRYFLARSVTTMGRMAMPFYILYVGTTLHLSGQTLAVLTITFTISATISNLAWGFIADRRGFRFTFLISIILWIAATLMLLLGSGMLLTILVFAAIGAAAQGFMNASQNLTLEFGHRNDLPMRIGLANSCSEFAGALGPLLGGLLATLYGYEMVFWASAAFLTIGATVVLRSVPDPRYT